MASPAGLCVDNGVTATYSVSIESIEVMKVARFAGEESLNEHSVCTEPAKVASLDAHQPFSFARWSIDVSPPYRPIPEPERENHRS